VTSWLKETSKFEQLDQKKAAAGEKLKTD